MNHYGKEEEKKAKKNKKHLSRWSLGLLVAASHKETMSDLSTIMLILAEFRLITSIWSFLGSWFDLRGLLGRHLGCSLP